MWDGKRKTSTYSDGMQCVETEVGDDGRVRVTHSKGKDGFTTEEWAAFVQGVKDGEFDLA